MAKLVKSKGLMIWTHNAQYLVNKKQLAILKYIQQLTPPMDVNYTNCEHDDNNEKKNDCSNSCRGIGRDKCGAGNK